MGELHAARKMSHLHQAMTTPPPLLSRPFPLRRLGADPIELRIDATPEECAAIARAFDLPRLATLSGRFRLVPMRGDRIDLHLDLEAKVTRLCVVSLEEFDQTVRERAAVVMVPEGGDSAPGDEAEFLDPDMPDEVPIAGESIDLGALLAEQLALALDPYPRRPGATPPAPHSIGEAEAPVRSNPFAALAELKKDGRDGGDVD